MGIETEEPNQKPPTFWQMLHLSLIHISEPTRQAEISYAVFCLKKKKRKNRPADSGCRAASNTHLRAHAKCRKI